MSGLPAKPTLRRITWCRVHHELLQQDLWALVADMARVELALVEAFVLRLEIYASAHTPRGSVEGFNIAALAAKWRRDKEELARLYATLEHPEVGWLDQDYIVNFWERNPDTEDPTATERQRRRRERIRKEKEARGEIAVRRPREYPPAQLAQLAPRYQPTPEEALAQVARIRVAAAERSRRYRSRRTGLGLDGDIDDEAVRPSLAARDGGEQCIYCLSIKHLAIDHMVPLAQGGTDEIDNLGLACRGCNGAKGGRTPAQADMIILIESAAAAHARFVHNHVTREPVTLTTRSDQNIKQERLVEEEIANPQESPRAPAPAAIHSESGESGDRPIDPEVWLAFEGKRIVAERMQLLPSRAWLELNRWRKELADDLDKLVSLIHDADSLGLERGKFGDRIRGEIIRWRYEQKGPALPLPPASVKSRRHG